MAAIRTEGIGPEGPPTASRAEELKAFSLHQEWRT
ncbi:DUF6053 domain-containing protein [Lysobacter enzymogenes]